MLKIIIIEGLHSYSQRPTRKLLISIEAIPMTMIGNYISSAACLLEKTLWRWIMLLAFNEGWFMASSKTHAIILIIFWGMLFNKKWLRIITSSFEGSKSTVLHRACSSRRVLLISLILPFLYERFFLCHFSYEI